MKNFKFHDFFWNHPKKIRRDIFYFLFCLTLFNGQILSAQTYCAATTSGDINWNGTITSFITTGGITNISNETGTTPALNGYEDFTNLSVSHFETGEINFTINFNNALGGNVWIDWNNNMEFEENEKVFSSGTVSWGPSFSGTFSIPSGTPVGDYRIRVRLAYGNSNPSPCGNVGGGGETEDYILTVVSPPTCMPPVELGSNISSFTSAELFWVSEGPTFEVQYGLENFILDIGTSITNITTNSTLVSELDKNTLYHFYVRRDCDGDLSPWTGPYTFYTGYCFASSTNPMFGIEGFSTIDGYTNITNTNNGTSNSYTNYSDLIVSQSSGGNFDYAINVSSNTNVAIWIDYNNNMLFETDELVASHQYSSIPTTFIGSINIPDNLQSGDYQIRVRSRFYSVTEVNPCGSLDYGETEDYTLSIVPIPDCVPPIGLTIENPTLNTAEFVWNSEGNTFDVEYGLQGFTLGNGTLLTDITTTSLAISNLDSSTWYSFYVRKNCDENGFSTWAGPYTFYTEYCIATSNYPEEVTISSFTTTGGSSNISNETGNIPSLNGYGNFAEMSVSHYETGVFDFTMIASQDWFTGFNIWIDWNNNMVFEENENVFTSSASTPVTGSIMIPFGTPVGDYRIRVQFAYDSNNPCGTIDFGETEDYTLTVIPSPLCLPPFNPTTTNISTTSVLLSWLSHGDLFNIEYGLEGFEQGSENAIIITGISNPFILSDLIPETSYEFYISQDCEDGNVWNGPIKFTSGAYQGNIPTLLNNNPQVDDISCASSFSINIPEGQYLSELKLEYSMLSASPAWTSQQRSVLYSPTLGIGEQEIFNGETDLPGILEYERNVTFANGSTGTVEFVLKAWRTSGGIGCSTDRIYVIDGSWILTPSFEDIPTCPNPATNLGYTNITEDSVDLVWTAEEGEFQVIWGTKDFNIESEGTLISDITTNSHSLSELDSSVIYEFYVRRNCSNEENEDYGDWVGPVKFNAGHCIPFTSDLAYYFTQFNTTGAIENITFLYPSGSPLGTGYKNETDMIIVQEAGASFNFSANYSGGPSGLRIWIDWNNDFIFEDSEQIFYLGNGSGSKSGTITIPEGTASGNYRMRIRAQQATGSVPPACGSINTGEAIDFTLNIPCDELITPIGNTEQDFQEGDTIADLNVTGDNLVWYANSELTEILEETTLLVDETNYYVVNQEGNCQSDVLVITVNEVLSTSDFTKFGFGYQPNPVSEILYLKSNTEINEVIVFNIVGQELKLPIQANNTQINMSQLPSGNYIVNVTIEGVNKTFKIVKQ